MRSKTKARKNFTISNTSKVKMFPGGSEQRYARFHLFAVGGFDNLYFGDLIKLFSIHSCVPKRHMHDNGEGHRKIRG